ncbi:hypothetical protein EI555_008831, partial [Monodon monoceros]
RLRGPWGSPTPTDRRLKSVHLYPSCGPDPTQRQRQGPQRVWLVSVSGGDWEPVPHAAYLLLFVLSQHSNETQRPALVPCPEGTYEITRKTRRQCRACRLPPAQVPGERLQERQHLRLLLAIPAVITSDTAVEQKRAFIRRKKREQIGTQTPGAKALTEEQQVMIRELIIAQVKTADGIFTHFKNFRTQSNEEAAKWCKIREDLRSVKVSLQLRGEDGSIWNYKPAADNSAKEISSLLPHVADTSTYVFKGIINFAKVGHRGRVDGVERSRKWPIGSNGLGDLLIEDQISLLKAAAFELCQLRFNTVFNAETRTWECGAREMPVCPGRGWETAVEGGEEPRQVTWVLGLQGIRLGNGKKDLGGFQQLLLEPVLKFHYMRKKVHLHKEEYVLMQAISLFSPDRPGVGQCRLLDQLQEWFAITLKAYIKCNRPWPAYRFLFLKIMAMLTELRSINVQRTQWLLHIQDIHPFATPLTQKLFSITNG